MGAQRKLVDPVHSEPLADTAVVATPVDYETPRNADGTIPASPAILLQERLAARLAETTAATADVLDEAGVTQPKLPMAWRVATILGLSVGLWGGVILAAFAILT